MLLLIRVLHRGVPTRYSYQAFPTEFLPGYLPNTRSAPARHHTSENAECPKRFGFISCAASGAPACRPFSAAPLRALHGPWLASALARWRAAPDHWKLWTALSRGTWAHDQRMFLRCLPPLVSLPWKSSSRRRSLQPFDSVATSTSASTAVVSLNQMLLPRCALCLSLLAHRGALDARAAHTADPRLLPCAPRPGS